MLRQLNAVAVEREQVEEIFGSSCCYASDGMFELPPFHPLTILLRGILIVEDATQPLKTRHHDYDDLKAYLTSTIARSRRTVVLGQPETDGSRAFFDDFITGGHQRRTLWLAFSRTIELLSDLPNVTGLVFDAETQHHLQETLKGLYEAQQIATGVKKSKKTAAPYKRVFQSRRAALSSRNDVNTSNGAESGVEKGDHKDDTLGSSAGVAESDESSDDDDEEDSHLWALSMPLVQLADLLAKDVFPAFTRLIKRTVWWRFTHCAGSDAICALPTVAQDVVQHLVIGGTMITDVESLVQTIGTCSNLESLFLDMHVLKKAPEPLFDETWMALPRSLSGFKSFKSLDLRLWRADDSLFDFVSRFAGLERLRLDIRKENAYLLPSPPFDLHPSPSSLSSLTIESQQLNHALVFLARLSPPHLRSLSLSLAPPFRQTQQTTTTSFPSSDSPHSIPSSPSTSPSPTPHTPPSLPSRRMRLAQTSSASNETFARFARLSISTFSSHGVVQTRERWEGSGGAVGGFGANRGTVALGD